MDSFTLSAVLFLPSLFASIQSIYKSSFLHFCTSRIRHRSPMEKGDDSARAVGMCDRFMTFLARNLPVNRQKTIAEGPRNGGSHRKNQAEEEEEEDDEFEVKIEKVEFELSGHQEEDHRRVTATVLEERNAGASTARASEQQRQKEAVAEAGREVAAAAAAAAVAVPQEEKKVRKSVTIKEEAAGGDKDKKSLLKKRQASTGGQVGAAGGEDPKPRWGLRPRMPSILRVPSNINEKSTTFIQERKRRFSGGGKPEK